MACSKSFLALLLILLPNLTTASSVTIGSSQTLPSNGSSWSQGNPGPYCSVDSTSTLVTSSAGLLTANAGNLAVSGKSRMNVQNQVSTWGDIFIQEQSLLDCGTGTVVQTHNYSSITVTQTQFFIGDGASLTVGENSQLMSNLSKLSIGEWATFSVGKMSAINFDGACALSPPVSVGAGTNVTIGNFANLDIQGPFEIGTLQGVYFIAGDRTKLQVNCGGGSLTVETGSVVIGDSAEITISGTVVVHGTLTTGQHSALEIDSGAALSIESGTIAIGDHASLQMNQHATVTVTFPITLGTQSSFVVPASTSLQGTPFAGIILGDRSQLVASDGANHDCFVYGTLTVPEGITASLANFTSAVFCGASEEVELFKHSRK